MMHHRGRGPFGKWFQEEFGPRGLQAARFERGDLKLVILDLLRDTPRHGYDIIQQLEQEFHGFYSPSPGSVYPILQMLNDQQLIEGVERSGKKVYSLTAEGKGFLRDHQDEVATVRSRMEPPWHADTTDWIHQLRDEIGQTARLLFSQAGDGKLRDPETVQRVHEAFEHFRNELKQIFQEKV
jgi:DNA-binding PadR family transcriptional regulator